MGGCWRVFILPICGGSNANAMVNINQKLVSSSLLNKMNKQKKEVV